MQPPDNAYSWALYRLFHHHHKFSYLHDWRANVVVLNEGATVRLLAEHWCIVIDVTNNYPDDLLGHSSGNGSAVLTSEDDHVVLGTLPVQCRRCYYLIITKQDK